MYKVKVENASAVYVPGTYVPEHVPKQVDVQDYAYSTSSKTESTQPILYDPSKPIEVVPDVDAKMKNTAPIGNLLKVWTGQIEFKEYSTISFEANIYSDNDIMMF